MRPTEAAKALSEDSVKRTPIRKISKKKLKSLGGKTPFSTVTGPRKALPKGKCECGHPSAIHSRAEAGSERLGLCLKPRCHCRVYRPKTIKRGKPPKARGKKGSRFPKRRDKAFTEWVAKHECCLRESVRGCWHPGEEMERGRFSDPAHIGKTRGAGAYDKGEVANLCRRHHRMQEGKTKQFEQVFDVNLRVVARELAARYDHEFSVEPSDPKERAE